MILSAKKTNFAIALAVALLSAQLYANDLKTDVEKESYSIGASTGKYVGNQIVRQTELGLKIDIDAVVDGFVDALQDKSLLKEEDIIQHLNTRAEALNKAQENMLKEVKANNAKKEQEFLDNNKKNPKVKVTKSGLQYEVLKDGKGKPEAKPESIIITNYKAYLPDGYVFEDMQDEKNPAHLSMVNVIDGLREGLMLMNEGAKYKFYIPSKLAYKDTYMMEIEPNSTLIFEVELKKVLKPGELKPKEKFELMMDEKNKKELKEDK